MVIDPRRKRFSVLNMQLWQSFFRVTFFQPKLSQILFVFIGFFKKPSASKKTEFQNLASEKPSSQPWSKPNPKQGWRRVKNWVAQRRSKPVLCSSCVFKVPLLVCVYLQRKHLTKRVDCDIQNKLSSLLPKTSMRSSFFHTLFETWVARCIPNSDLGRAQQSLRTADLAILV